MLALPVVTVAIVVSSLPMQADSTANIRGVASSAVNGRPIAGVMISLPAADKFAVTDPAGAFRLDRLPTGPQRLRISYDGRETEEFVFNLDRDDAKQIAVLLDVDADDLDPIVVEARHPNLWRDLAGFYARRNVYRGFGQFITREEIRRSRPNTVSALLATEGIMVRCVQGCLPVRYIHDALCVVPVSVDGLPYRELDYDLLPVGSLAGVEVYRGTPPSGLNPVTEMTTPNSVWQGGRYNAAGSCGSVMIWTREKS